MSDIVEVELPNGKKLYFDAGSGAGFHDVSALAAAANVSAGQFEEALGTLGALIGMLEKTVDALPSRPAKVEVEFSASISGNCNLILVKGEGKAEFKVKLAWDGERAKPSPISGELLHSFVPPK